MHSAAQKSVSGNLQRGCEAIIISGRRSDALGEDQFTSLCFVAEHGIGGGALLLNLKQMLPVRVFRSSRKTNCFRAEEFKKGQTSYRYDGIYRVKQVRYMDNGEWTHEDRSTVPERGVPNRVYHFDMERIEVGSDLTNKNKLSDDDLLSMVPLHCRAPLEVTKTTSKRNAAKLLLHLKERVEETPPEIQLPPPLTPTERALILLLNMRQDVSPLQLQWPPMSTPWDYVLTSLLSMHADTPLQDIDSAPRVVSPYTSPQK